MKLCLRGHDYQYAAEQMLLTLFPGQRPEYAPSGVPAGEDGAVLSLSQGPVWVTASAVLTWKGARYAARRRCPAAELKDPLSTDRACQRILKLAFYDAGAAALGAHPPWGALTGVRPVKLPTRAMLRGDSPARARRTLTGLYHVSPLRAELAMDCARAALRARETLRRDEVSLYIGIPFCPTRCAYCSFISADVGRALKLVEPFLDLLCREVAAAGRALKERGVFIRTVYMGGGTPTTLTAPQLERLLSAMEDHLPLARCTEFTVEAGRPDTITPDRMAVLRSHGVDRVSVNPQSMEDHVLSAMGRSHTAADILRAYETARAAGFPAVNMDLIAGLPADSPAGFCRTLDAVLALAPENITVHTLALKKGSRLMEQGGSVPTGDAVAAMLDHAWAALRSAGYVPYYLYRQKYMSGSFENVGWARPGYESLYNIAMMEELHTVISLGGGGVTKLVDQDTGAIRRLANPKYPQEYLTAEARICAYKEEAAAFAAAHCQPGCAPV